MTCWNCQTEAGSSPVCPSCGKLVERAPGLTYFDAFGLPPRFALDPLTLEGGFRERSLQFHPDRFAQGSPKERRLALEHSTALNEAYKTLKDPARRAFYLLKLRGIDLGREDAGTQQGMPPAFLEEVLDLSESLDEAAARKDLERARVLAGQVSQKRAQALSAGVAALEIDPPGERSLTEAAHQLGRVRYFNRFLEQVDTLEEEALG